MKLIKMRITTLSKNQFIFSDESGNEFFQSYNSIIAKKTIDGKIFLDSYFWDYSRTTSKYRNRFTGLTTSETKKLIKSGEIELINLN